ncbi:MAG TPA: ATP-binding protein [Actinomycetes bacterium]|nr:ATP-binding protein [Actinomycetes bacterium]
MPIGRDTEDLLAGTPAGTGYGERRLAFLAEAGKLLDRSLDVEQTLAGVARLPVPEVADLCLVDVLEDGTLRRVAVVHADPDHAGATVPAEPLLEVARTGQGMAVDQLVTVLEELASPEQLRLLKELGLRALISVPMAARGHNLGVLTLGRCPRQEVPFTAEDYTFAEELACRAALAIDSARLVADLQAARRATEQANMLLDTFFAAAPVGFCVLDDDLRYLRVNRPLAVINGLPVEAHIGRTPGEVLPAPAGQQAERLLRQVVAAGVPVTDLQFSGETDDAPGVERHWVGAFYPMRSREGRSLGAGVVVNEVTAQKQIERELERSNQELNQFAYAASHDLREPLRAIAGHAKLLQRLQADRLDPEAGEHLEFIVDGAARMQALVDDLLDYAQAGQAELRRAPVEVASLLERCLRQLAPAISQAGAEVRSGPLPTVHGDETQLGQVLRNLIANAVKYQRGGRPLVEVSAAREPDAWRISVADNGIGIDPAQAQRVFEMFQRLHSQRHYPGTGIGLALCKRIAERHGGRIWFEPRPEGGTTFHFTVPDQPPT